MGHAGSFPQGAKVPGVGSCGVLDDLGMLPVRGGELPGRETRPTGTFEGWKSLGCPQGVRYCVWAWIPVERL